MPRDYSWARQAIPCNMATVGELAIILGVGRHQARRRLLASGLPVKLVTRRWKDQDECWWVRRTWAIPLETFKTLLIQQIERDWYRDAKLAGRQASRFPRERFYDDDGIAPSSLEVSWDYW